MMMAGLIIMFGCTLAARIMRERSLQLLSAEQKVQLVDSFSRNRVLYLAIMFGVVILYVLANRLAMSYGPSESQTHTSAHFTVRGCWSMWG